MNRTVYLSVNNLGLACHELDGGSKSSMLRLVYNNLIRRCPRRLQHRCICALYDSSLWWDSSNSQPNPTGPSICNRKWRRDRYNYTCLSLLAIAIVLHYRYRSTSRSLNASGPNHSLAPFERLDNRALDAIVVPVKGVRPRPEKGGWQQWQSSS